MYGYYAIARARNTCILLLVCTISMNTGQLCTFVWERSFLLVARYALLVVFKTSPYSDHLHYTFIHLPHSFIHMVLKFNDCRQRMAIHSDTVNSQACKGALLLEIGTRTTRFLMNEHLFIMFTACGRCSNGQSYTPLCLQSLKFGILCVKL